VPSACAPFLRRLGGEAKNGEGESVLCWRRFALATMSFDIPFWDMKHPLEIA
jgi:hypothetical protein